MCCGKKIDSNVKIPQQQQSIVNKIDQTNNQVIKSNRVRPGSSIKVCPACKTSTIGTICPICSTLLK